ncbi:MAG: LamG domain-containing protein [Victivallaceae bacterium]|nr:LamG domain-containing protein [Victivallaceae bacterium]
MKLTRTIILTVLMLAGISVLAEPKLIFHAPFDTDFTAKIHGKTAPGKHTQKVVFESLSRLLQPGVKDKAALIGKIGKNPGDFFSITYPGENIINTKQGTISFWVKPVDWQATDHNFHIFFEASGKDSFLVIYKYFDNRDLFFLYGAKKAKSRKERAYTIARKNIRNWKLNQWHFITCTWNEQKIWLYLDGLVVDTKPVATPPRTPFPWVKIGGSKSWKTLMDKTLIDDVKIFDAPLSAQQVAALYGSYKFSKPMLNNAPLKISKVFARTERTKKVLRLSFLLSRFRSDFKPYKVKVELLNSTKKVVAQQIFTSSDTEYDKTIDVSLLAPGRYTIRITPIVGKGEKASINEIAYAIPTSPPAWINSQCGISAKVPAPWTAIKLLDDNTVTCWGRKFMFANQLFPVQISSGKYELLNNPMQLVINGKPFTAPAKFKVLKQTPTAIEFENSASNGQLTITANITIEYDGFMWLKLKVTPKTSFTVNRMTLEVPIRKNCATLFNQMRKFYMHNKKGFAGTLTNKTINSDLYQYDPVIWVGNEDIGLEWFAETLKGWHNSKKAQTLQLITENRTKVLRLNIVDTKIVLNKTRNLAFGFQPTPVRPLVKNWRKQRDQQNIKIWFPWSSRHNVPDTEFTKSNYQVVRKDYERKFTRPFHYFAGFTMSPYFPEWPWWAELWSKNPPVTGSYAKPNDLQWAEAFVCNNSPSYRDFYTWKFKATQKKLDMKNLYFDNQWPNRCRNKAHGCGWTDDDGVLHDTYSLLGARDLAKRMYVMVKDYDPDAMIVRHMSAKHITPVNSFSDILVDGELYLGSVAKDESYYNIFEPAMFRASFLSRQFGQPNLFIPQFARAFKNHRRSKYKPFLAGKLKNQQQHLRHFKGYFLVHDAKIYPIFGIEMDDFWRLEDEFGMADDTPFFGYWMEQKPLKLVKPNNERAMVSAYIDQGKAMFILMNDTDRQRAFTIKLDLKQMAKYGLGSIKQLTDAESKTVIKVNNATFKVTMKPRDYRILIFRQ